MVERRDFVRSFRAYDDLGGEHHLFLFAKAVDAADPEGPRGGRAPLAPEIWMADGRALEYLVKGRYRAASGELLRSDDPDAP